MACWSWSRVRAATGKVSDTAAADALLLSRGVVSSDTVSQNKMLIEKISAKITKTK